MSKLYLWQGLFSCLFESVEGTGRVCRRNMDGAESVGIAVVSVAVSVGNDEAKYL